MPAKKAQIEFIFDPEDYNMGAAPRNQRTPVDLVFAMLQHDTDFPEGLVTVKVGETTKIASLYGPLPPPEPEEEEEEPGVRWELAIGAYQPAGEPHPVLQSVLVRKHFEEQRIVWSSQVIRRSEGDGYTFLLEACKGRPIWMYGQTPKPLV